MIPGNEALEPERLSGHRGIDGSPTFPVGLKGIAVPATPDFVLFAAAYKIVLVRIQREKHPQVPVRIDVEHEQVPILLGTDLNLGALAREKPTIVVDPDLDWWVLPQLAGVGPSGVSGEHQRKEQREDHSTSLNLMNDNFEPSVGYADTENLMNSPANRVPPHTLLKYIYLGISAGI
jgi:hypothetical protein